jgi:hypothetical protein
MKLPLNGPWDCGERRSYDRQVTVPGLATDPSRINEDRLWYRRQIALPEGDWTGATLILNGARFCPAVYVNGRRVSQSEGGMTVTRHRLALPDVAPGRTITLEVALAPLSEVDPRDASRIPQADLWRSNVSSCLWDKVGLKLHGRTSLERIVPFIDAENMRVTLRWRLSTHDPGGSPVRLVWQVLSDEGRPLLEKRLEDARAGEATMDLSGICQTWSPEHPRLYRLRGSLVRRGRELDCEELALGIRDFRTEGKRFSLNGRPATLRAGTVVWHRWLRDPEARELAFDTDWFERNIVLRLKSHGANALRFHLGTPPEALLNLCDAHGLMVQIEWPFFHGMKASKESLRCQWRSWLDLCMRHPCICIIHPWNETEGDELQPAFEVLDELSAEYPPLVISHRDVIHVHKYWWSMFENLGLYYDSAEQFPKPVMADEFGGNYLDGEGDPGGYPALRGGFHRFLGRGHTRELRLQLHCESNTQVAEYWRRIGAAGFSPFCALGSPEDGNHHFLGPIEQGRPKEVWAALTAAWSPLGCSLEVWDRNFLPGRRAGLPLYFFNDTDDGARLAAVVRVVREGSRNEVMAGETVECETPAHAIRKTTASIRLPATEGEWRFQAVLTNPPPPVRHPVVSSWRFRTFEAKVPQALRGVKVAICPGEDELKRSLTSLNIDTCDFDGAEGDVVAASRLTWRRLADGEGARRELAAAIERGCGVVMLDVGPMPLGQGYLPAGRLGPLQGPMPIDEPKVTEVGLFPGVALRFSEVPEPESHVHPSDVDDSLWEGLDRQATWLWNGLRGGLIVPACDMEPLGLSRSAFVALWTQRGADSDKLTRGPYYAYELAGSYAFASRRDEGVKNELRRRVAFLVEDAPALRASIDPGAAIREHDLAALYGRSRSGRAERLTPLACCGKDLARVPVVRISFGKGEGVLVVSQLITAGRLADGFGTDGLYGIRRDPAAGQVVLNMLANCLRGGRT